MTDHVSSSQSHGVSIWTTLILPRRVSGDSFDHHLSGHSPLCDRSKGGPDTMPSSTTSILKLELGLDNTRKDPTHPPPQRPTFLSLYHRITGSSGMNTSTEQTRPTPSPWGM